MELPPWIKLDARRADSEVRSFAEVLMLVDIHAVPAVAPSRTGGQEVRPPFVPGELVDVRVQEAERPGSLIILIKGIPFQAVSYAGPLKAGEVFQARVEQTEGRLLLRLQPGDLPSPSSDTSTDQVADGAILWLRRLLPAEESFTAALDRLIDNLRMTVRTEPMRAQWLGRLEGLLAKILLHGEHLDGRQLKNALRDLGLQYESHLARLIQRDGQLPSPLPEPTLKSWLLEQVRTEQRSNATAAPSTWLKQAEEVIKALDRTQVLNVVNLASGQPLVLTLPLTDGKVLLYIDPQPKGQGADDEPAHRFSTILELDGLGRVRVDAVLTGKRLSARILLDRAETESFVASKLFGLTEALSSKGYVIDVSAIRGGEEILNGEDLKSRALPHRPLVNVDV